MLILRFLTLAALALGASRHHKKPGPDASEQELAFWGLVLFGLICFGYLLFILRKGGGWSKVVPKLRAMGVLLVAKLIAVGMLLGTLSHPPYGYYNLLRFVVCGVAGYAAFRASEIGKKGWGLTFVVVALLFNPVIPVHLGREAWVLVDLGIALLLLVSVAALDRHLPTG